MRVLLDVPWYLACSKMLLKFACVTAIAGVWVTRNSIQPLRQVKSSQVFTPTIQKKKGGAR
jgi:hypothetical protein